VTEQTARRRSPGPGEGPRVHNHSRTVTIQRPLGPVVQLLRLGPHTAINLAAVARFDLVSYPNPYVSYPNPYVMTTLISGERIYYDGDHGQVLRAWLQEQAPALGITS